MAREKHYLNLTWQDPESGDARVRDYPLPVTIGRDSSNAVVLPGSGVSRQHCHIDVEADEVFISDLGSSNGTILNGEAVKKSKLSEGDELQIGDITLTVSFSISRRATTMDNLFDALIEGEAEATITLRSLKKKDLFADIEMPEISSPGEEPIEASKIKTSELTQPESLSGEQLKDFLSHGLQQDIEQDIAPDIDRMTRDVRTEHADAMKKLQSQANEKHAEPQGAIDKLLATLRRLFGG
jgi:pSer/pThr/pTyr-binding forkhead associated (FHA) protein